MKYFIANWKAHKDLPETNDWITKFLATYKADENKKIIICPPLPLIFSLKEKIKDIPNLHLGAQNISDIDEGNFTGEVTAKSLHGLVDFVILGHSERRRLFNETSEALAKKIRLAKKYNLQSILCIRNKEDLVTESTKFLAYEPTHAIGTGENESLPEVIVAKKSLNIPSETIFIYGGSVNSVNVKTYFNTSEISGFLIGTASLSAEEFTNIISS